MQVTKFENYCIQMKVTFLQLPKLSNCLKIPVVTLTLNEQSKTYPPTQIQVSTR